MVTGGILNAGTISGDVGLGGSTLILAGNRAVLGGSVSGTTGDGSTVSVGDVNYSAAFTATNKVSVDNITVNSGSSLTLSPSAHWSAADGTVNNGTLTLESGSILDGALSQNGLLLFSTEKNASSVINASLINRGSLVLNPTPTSAGNTLTVNGDYTGLPGSSVSLGSVLGGDVIQGSTNGTDALHAGLMGGYGRADSSSHNGLTGRDAKGSVSGYSAGVYGTWYQNAEVKTGAWAETWAQYNWFRNEVSGDMLQTERYSSQGIKASVEGGYAWQVKSWQSGPGMENRVFIEPHAQAIWSGIRADDHTEAGGTRVQGTGNDGVTTRLGLRTYLNGKSRADRQTVREFQPFVEVNWLHNTEVYGVRMNGETDSVSGTRNIAELKTGVEGRLSERLSGALVFTQQAGGGGYRDSQGSLQVSYRF